MLVGKLFSIVELKLNMRSICNRNGENNKSMFLLFYKWRKLKIIILINYWVKKICIG